MRCPVNPLLGLTFPPELITLLVIQNTSLAFSMELAGQISLPATNAGNQITADKAEKRKMKKAGHNVIASLP